MNVKTTYTFIHEIGQRANQEDSVFPDSGVAPVPELYLVCDGMGGHEGGEIASAAVCRGISSYIASNQSPVFALESFREALSAGYDALDAVDNGADQKMGTTLTFARFHQGGCLVAHIGDSKIYHVRPSQRRILYVSRDHSIVNDLILLGEITPEEAKDYPGKNIITRAMMPNTGRRDKAEAKEIADVLPGDYFFLCSDGIMENHTDQDILDLCCLGMSDLEKMEALRNNTVSNKDNHTAMLIKVLSI